MARPRLYSDAERERRRRETQCRSRVQIAAEIAAAKLKRGCARCGYAEHPDALQFDHIEPLRVSARTRAKQHRIESRAALYRALADTNIQVLCGNCHNIKSIAERRGGCLSSS